MLDTVLKWLAWFSLGVPEVWIPRDSPLFEAARAIWTMFLILALMMLVSLVARSRWFRRLFGIRSDKSH
jgi:apolipoprotein N-acyltransferase